MPSLEYAVRPYQSPGRNNFLIPSAPSVTNQRATLTWGATSTPPKPEPGISVQLKDEQKCKETLNELTRDTERVTIPVTTTEDGTGSITVDRPKTLTLSKHETGAQPPTTYGGGMTQQADFAVGGDWAMAPEFGSMAPYVGSGVAPPGGNDCDTTWKFKN
jgi:hypothetical protein